MLIVSLRFVDFFLFNQLKEVKDFFLKNTIHCTKVSEIFHNKEQL